MDPDSSTGGLNENSESGELDSFPGDGDYHFNSNSVDSLSKQSVNSERTNIDALDDTARDTIIVPPLDDSSSSTSLKRLPSNSLLKGGEDQDHDLLDFGGDDEGDKEEGEDDDSDEGELLEPSSVERSPGELSNHSADALAGLEDGEVDDDGPPQPPQEKKMIKTSKIREKEELVGDELEEGEVSDDEERRNKGPMPVCRFFGKGQCTWGSNCRFLHPGVIDKGLYTMFDKVKPPPPVAPIFPKPGLLGHAPPNFPIPPALRVEAPIIETPWERAQRQAKELMKQSEKIKESDIDFEDKKMNLTLTQEEFDKENDYYVKKLTTPERDPPPEDDEPEINEWDLPSRRPSHPPKIDPNFVRERVHHLKPPGRGIRQAPPRDSIREAPPLHDPEVRMVRESNLRRTSRFHPAPDSPPPQASRIPIRSGSYEDNPEPRRGRERGKPKDEWHDPWARPQEHKGGKNRKGVSLSKRSSYSSASSRSSSSSSQLSKSSKSSLSRSRSRSSKSSRGSPTPRKSRKDDVVRKAPPRRLSPKPMRIAPPLPKEDFGDRRGGFGQQNYNRPPRYAPPPPPVRSGGSGMKDRMGDKPPQTNYAKNREMRGSKRPLMESWTGRSSSRSRSHSRSRSFSKSPQMRRASGPIKRSKFSRERSRSKSNSPKKKSWSRSSSGSSSRSSNLKFGPAVAKPARAFGDFDKDKTDNRKGNTGKMAMDKIPPAKQIKAEPSDEPRMKFKTEQSKSKVKLTLRPSSGIKMNKSILDKLADDVMGVDDDDNSNPNSGGGNSRAASGDEESQIPGRMKQSRREELLKQLQKVEEAIAKKRSKIT